MSKDLDQIIKSVRESQYSFCKFISPNDAGDTGAHQAGLYIPKNSIQLLFDEPGEKGKNKEKFATIKWGDGEESECRFIYYGQGSRNEYRITRLGKHFKVGELVVIVRQTNDLYSGYLLSEKKQIADFLEAFAIKEDQTNALIPVRHEEDNAEVYETNEINFKPKAHILVLLGEELIKSPVMAIYELIKNGYDADATFVKVEFENIEDIDNAKIVIEDDGTGMKEEVLTNVWFEPGSDFRKPIGEDGKRTIKRSAVYGRIPMGEKGVGRFAVHKLGNRIILRSRPGRTVFDDKGKVIEIIPLDYELEVDIDWRKFSQSKYLDDVIIEWKKNTNPDTFYFKNAPGTLIEIKSLKESWTRGMARQLKRNTISMLSPKNDLSKFRIDLNFNNGWLWDMPDTEEILERAPYKLNVLVDKDYNMTFEYKFELKNNPEIGSRCINKKTSDRIDKTKYEINIKGLFRSDYEEYLNERGFESEVIAKLLQRFDKQEEGLPYGNLMLELYSFDLDAASLRDYIPTPRLVKELLRDHAGIKVFKGDLRVYDYGDPGNDWLGLDIRRVNNKTWFSNNQNIGYVYLDDSTSGILIEKTNREGFIENEAYEHFRLLVVFILNQFRAERLSDREKWLLFNKKGTDSSFESQLRDFKSLINNIVLADPEKKQELLQEAERIETRYEQDKNTLLIPAGVGMTASFAMHEIEKLVPRMEETVEYDPVDGEKIRDQVAELKDYVEGILSVLRKGGDKPVDVKSAIQQAISNYSLRLKSRRIEVEYVFEPDSQAVVCDRRLLITMLMNLADNSLYWLDTVYKDEKGIFIKAEAIQDGVSILFVDNGPGFKDKVEDLVRPFFTRKKGGIGIGMYLIDTVMMKYGRLNIIYDSSYLRTRGVPEKFNGAAVELIFKNEAK